MNKLEPSALVLLVLAPLMLVILLGNRAYTIFAFVPIYLGTLILIIPLHEAGHGLMGATMGLRISRIVVGRGRVLAQRRIGGVVCELRLIPLGGLTLAAPFEGARFLRTRVWLFALGGPLVDGALMWLGWRLSARLHDHPLGPMLQTAAWAATTQLFFDLLPQQISANGVKIGTDGRQLLSIPFMKPDEVKVMYASQYLLEGAERGEAGDDAGALAAFERGLARYPGVAALRQYRALALHLLGRDDEALAEASSLLASADSAVRPIVLNDWAWYAFHRGDERDLPLAEQRSAEALAMLPDLTAVSGTRGAVLLWQGRVAAALPLLKRGYEGAASKRHRATDGCLLATAHAALGNEAQARKYLDAARAADANCDLLPGADTTVAAMTSGARRMDAARGRRAVVVHDDELELIGGRWPSQRVGFATVRTAQATLTVRGGAQLLIEHDGGRWRMPLHRGALGATRIALHALMREAPAPAVPLPQQQASLRHRLGTAGRLVGTGATIALIVGRLQSDPPFTDILTMVLAMVASYAPGPGPLLALGSAMLLQRLVEFLGLSELPPPSGGWAWFWFAALGVIAAMALWVGWSGRRTGPEGRRQALRTTVAVLIVMMLPGAMTALTTIMSMTVYQLHKVASQVAPFAVGAMSLAVVLLALARPRFRVPGAVLGAAGAACLVMCSGWLYETMVLASLGPRPAPLAWTSRPAVVLRRVQLPEGARAITVSPGGLMWVATARRSAAEEAESERQDEDHDSPALALAAQQLIGDFSGRVQTVSGFAARFIDDQRLLILARTANEWQAREVTAADPNEVRRAHVVPVSRRPTLYRDEPRGTIYIDGGFSEAADPQRWVWSSDRGIDADKRHVAGQIGVFDDGRLVTVGSHVLRCPGWQTADRLFCVLSGVQPVQILTLDTATGAHQRVASIRLNRASISVLAAGRIAAIVDTDVVVIDATAGTATRMIDATGVRDQTRWLVPGNLTMGTASHEGNRWRTQLSVFSQP